MLRTNFFAEKLVASLLLLALPCIIIFAAPITFNITDYGAKGDNATMNTEFIQLAIDACARNGGGTVYFPAGRYLSGTIFLKSHVTLFLETGAAIIGSMNLVDYPVTIPSVRSYTDEYTDKSLIFGEQLENIAITGRGTIDGNGASFKGEYKVRPYTIRIIDCKDVLIRDITLVNSPMWVQHYLACSDVNIDGITVISRVNDNNDGIDIDGCDNVRISNCEIISGDDAIVLKSTLDKPCRNVTITNCVMSSNCNAFKLGTESNGGFRNITLNNCTIYDTRLCGISLLLVDGGLLDQVSISNVVMENVENAIFVRLGNRARPYNKNMAKPGVGMLSNVIINNIQASEIGSTGCSVTGLPDFLVENITLTNFRFAFKGGGTKELVGRQVPEIPENYPEHNMFGMLPAYGFFCRHIKNLTFNDIDLDFTETDARPALVCEDINGLEIHSLKAGVVANESLIHFRDVRNAFIRSCIAQPGTDSFLNLLGSGNKNITLLGNDLSGAKKAVKQEVASEVYLISNRLKNN